MYILLPLLPSIVTLLLGALVLKVSINKLGGKSTYGGAFVSLFLAGIVAELFSKFVGGLIGNIYLILLIQLGLVFVALYQMSLSYLNQDKKKTAIAVGITCFAVIVLSQVSLVLVSKILFS